MKSEFIQYIFKARFKIKYKENTQSQTYLLSSDQAH